MPTTTYSERPECQTSDCLSPAAMVKNLHDGRANYRLWCSLCHNRRTAAPYGFRYISQLSAQRAGLSLTEYTNRSHPSLKHRQPHCENVDGRLGFTCTTTILSSSQLDVDHVNGDPSDNARANLQTLCKCCHAYKTQQNQDWQTPGRKSLGVRY